MLEEEKEQIINLGLTVNGVTVFDVSTVKGMVAGEAETWSTAMFGNRLVKKFGDDLHKDIEINALGASSQVASEFLDAIIQKDTYAYGYEKFNLDWFTGMETLLEQNVIERLLQKLTHVKDLKVSNMKSLPEEVRE